MGPSTSFRKLNRPFYSCGLTTLGSVHTYPDILESATFSFWTRLSSTRIQWMQRTNPQLFESALQSGNFEYAMNPESCGRWIRIFFYPVMKQDRAQFFTVKGRERCKFPALDNAYSVANIPRGVLSTRVHPDTRIPGYVSDSCGRANSIWILIRVDVEIFQFGKNKFQIEKHRDSCGRGLRLWVNERLRLTLF